MILGCLKKEMVISPLLGGFEPNPRILRQLLDDMTLKTIVFEARASMLFPTLFTTHLTNHTAIHREEGVLG